MTAKLPGYIIDNTVNMKVKARRKLPRITLGDLEDGSPEVIPMKVPRGMRVNGSEYIFRVKPFAHQMAALRRMWEQDGGALLMEQGTGKTAVAIHFMGLKFLEGKCKRVLIICPRTVMGVWIKELRKHLPADFVDKVKLSRFYGNRKSRVAKIKRASTLGSKLAIGIINYESSWRLEKILKKFNPDIVIADESHRIKSARAKQSRAMWSLGDTVKYKLILTGTPIVSGAADVWSQFRFLDRDIFGDNWWRFQAYYLRKGGYFKKEIVGYKHLDILKRKLRSLSFIITKDECLDLPERTFPIVPVELTDKTKRLYNDMAEHLVAEIEDGSVSTATIVLVKLLRLSQITGGFLTDIDGGVHNIGSEKLETAIELIEDRVGDGSQVVVFTRFLPEIAELESELLKKKIACCTLMGSTKDKDRDQQREDFQNGKYSVFISQIQTGSLGISLTAADTAIFFSLDYSYGNYGQAIDRLHRIGQEKHVTYHHLIVPHSIDEIVYGTVKAKEDLAKLILRRPRAILLPG